MDAESEKCCQTSTPKHRLTVLIKNYKHPLKESSSPCKLTNKKSQYSTPVPKKHATNLESLSFVYPSNLELIQKIKKFKSISNSLNFNQDILYPILRNSNIAYGKMSLTLQQKIKERKNFVEYELPEDPIELDKLLRAIKETERVIRQENEFIYKIRKFKPIIQLKHKVKSNSTDSGSLGSRTGRRRNKTPIMLGRSGILVATSVKA